MNVTDPAQRTRILFHEALEMPAEERVAYLRSRCPGEPELQARVEGLLAAAEKDDAFLREPEETHIDLRSGEEPGRIIGPYRLIERLGEGGFGTVFLAEQREPVRRLVALKVVKAGMDTRAVVARFEQERQALAMMDHPHIARVFDAGATGAGRPYFVMELVQGEPLTTFCDRARLRIEERLGILEQICHAVQHAHTKGVIHRDLKPSNVLVSYQDGRPSAKVIDFGIAKATQQRLTDESFHTELRQFIGTPEYMSPEQARGSEDIDTRTDVYALGVLLYELLTGTTPFGAQELRAAGHGELQRIIREVDPSTPSTRLSRSGGTLDGIAEARGVPPRRLGSILRGELDWITMRALEKDRARRYQTAGELAADVGRYLRGEPVLAAPPSAVYRARKLLRRHRLVVGVGAIVAAALVSGTAVALWQASIAAEQRDAAREFATQADAARRDAEARRSETEQVAQFEAQRLGHIEVPAMGRRILAEIAEDARRGMLRAGTSEEHVAERLALLADLHGHVNPTDIALRTLDASIFEGARRAIDDQFGGQPTVRARLLHSLGLLLIELGLTERAEEMLVGAVDIRRRTQGDLHPETLSSILGLGLLRYHQARYAEAVACSREVYQARLASLGRQHADTLLAQNNLGLALLSQGRLKDAEDVLRSLLESSREVLEPGDPALLHIQATLGGLLMEQGLPAEAEPHFRQALEGARATYGADDTTPLLLGSNLALALERQDRLVEAEGHYRDSLERSRRVLGEDHGSTLLFKSNLGFLLCSLGDLVEAETLTLDALETRRRLMGGLHWDTLQSIHNTGVLLVAQGKHPQAEEHFREALAGRTSEFGAAHAAVTQTCEALAGLLAQQGRFEEAEELLLAAWNDVSGSGQSGPKQRSDRLRALVELHEAWEREDPDEARRDTAARWREELGALEADSSADPLAGAGGR